MIDEQLATASSGPVYLGPHRVWIESADGSAEPERHTIELLEPGVTEVVYFPAESDEECEIVAPVPIEAPVAPKAPPKRLLPRWAEIGVMVIGAGAVAAGGVLLGMDGKCRGGAGLDPMTDAAAVPDVERRDRVGVGVAGGWGGVAGDGDGDAVGG